jgi:hypothetical protein
MKMEQPVNAHKSGTITGLTVQAGATVASGAPVCEIKDLCEHPVCRWASHRIPAQRRHRRHRPRPPGRGPYRPTWLAAYSAWASVNPLP